MMMKKILSTLFIIIALAPSKSWAQEIKFPESFRSDPTLFKGMKLAEIPKDIQTKNGIKKNPTIITDVAKTKGALISGGLKGVKSIYMEIWANPANKKLNYGYEVAKFASVVDLDHVKPQLKPWAYGAILTVQKYLIIVKCVGSENSDEYVDRMVSYFQQKLGAKLIQDRLKEAKVAVTENYVSNLPPPLPPAPKDTSIAIELKDLERRVATTNGLAYIRNQKSQKLGPGNYRATSTYPVYETLEFAVDQDSLLHGDFLYHYAEDYSKSPSKESKLTYDHGVLTSEIMYANGHLLIAKDYSVAVVKEGEDYLTTVKTSIKKPEKGDKEVVTVFRNRKPISKITTRAGVSVIRKDFEKDYLDEFNNKGQLVRLEKPGLIEKYNSAGELIYKEEWSVGNHTVYKNGKLIKKEIRVKDKEQYLVTEYDESGKVTSERLKGIESNPVIADPDEYEDELTEALFNYYKKKVK